jgi:small-conductance mechanosensitive channel
MDVIKDILYFTLVDLGDFRLTVLNIIAIVAIILIAKLSVKLVHKLIVRYLSEHNWMHKKREKTLLSLTRNVVFIAGIIACIESLGLSNNNISFEKVLEHQLLSVPIEIKIYNVLVLIILIFATRITINVTRLILQHTLSDKEWVDEGKEYTIVLLAKYVVYTIAIILGMQSLGLNLSILLASSAALLVGLGLGLQSFFTDIVSGFILLFEGTVKKGDIVEVDLFIAKVIQINIRTSKVETRDGNIIIIPNSKLTQENVTNWSHSNRITRFKIEIGIAYGSDTAKVRELLLECAKAHPEVSQHHPLMVRFDGFGDSALEFELLFWAQKTWEIETVKSDLRFAIDKAFRENDIKIPFPQRDLHIVSDTSKKS